MSFFYSVTGNEFTGHCYSIVDSDAQDYKQRTPIVSAENEIGEDVDVYYVVRGTMSCDDDSIAHAVARETLASSVLSSSSSFSSSSSSFPPSPDRDTTAASDASIDADHPVSSSTAHTASARVDQSVLRVCQRLNRKRNGFLMQVKQKRKQRKQRKEEEEDCKGEIARFIAEADANASADGRELNPHTQKHNHDTTDANGADSNATDHSIFLIILTIPNTLHIHASRIGANDGSSNNIDITDNKGEGKDGHDEHDGSDGSGSGNGPVKRADALATYPFVPVCFHGSLPEDDENDESDPDHNSADDDDDKDDAYSSRFELVELADREMFLIDDSDNDLKGEEKGKLLGEHTVEGNSSLSTMRGDGGDGEHDTNNGNGHDRRDPLRKQGVMRKLEENYNFF